ncbi:hypothetical protein [Exiguobacterium sp. s161]|uniref:hypothetical protein n=1 Tax=Exiguobacterium sp. s161 TaxID=2751191 RepID=UPI001BE7BA1E|nr:hypothetical protein [Exiguobacterium sp. s161]
MGIRGKEIKAIEKVNQTFDSYEWNIESGDGIYDAINLPENSEDIGDIFVTKTKNNLYIALGSYFSRHYLDEDRYTKEKRYFISFLKDNHEIINLFTINDREYWRYKAQTELVNEDIIGNLYKNVFNKFYRVDDILNDFLAE